MQCKYSQDVSVYNFKLGISLVNAWKKSAFLQKKKIHFLNSSKDACKIQFKTIARSNVKSQFCEQNVHNEISKLITREILYTFSIKVSGLTRLLQ